ncbi:MAG: RluA family pseudouridine synthase [Prevotella sp.]|nr:RluA family pseudouridine synthase [Prevotella sp.]
MEVVYEDNHIIVVNKRSGEIVQGDKTGDTPLSELVKDYIKEKYRKPGAVFLGVTHRLDRPVSGLVVFARTSKALARLNKMFAEGEVHKTYWAIVESEKLTLKSDKLADAVPSDEGMAAANSSPFTHHSSLLTHWLTRNEQQNKSYAHDHEVAGSKKAMLRYRVIGQGERYALLEVLLLTGRHHQIRCQLAAIGCPIKGDLKYGARRSNPDGSISLLSRRIEFTHPVSKAPICLEAPLPADPLWGVLCS